MIEHSFTTNYLYHLDHRGTTQRTRVISWVGYIIEIENLSDLLIGFSVVGLAKNTLWVMNLSNFWLIVSTLKIEKLASGIKVQRNSIWSKFKNFYDKWKFNPISWVPDKLDFRWHHYRSEMTSSQMVWFPHDSRNSRNFKSQKSADNDLIGPNLIKIFKICITKNVLQKFHANPTCHSRVIA